MPVFNYQAVRGSERVKGKVEAGDQRLAVGRLKQMGLTPLEMTASVEAAPVFRAKGPGLSRLLISRRVSQKDITALTRQMATLLQSGLPLAKALSFLRRQVDRPALEEVISSLEERLRAGAALSAALAEHPNHFNQLYLSMTRAGETGGILEITMERLAAMREAQEDLRSKVKGALIYPVFMFLAMMGSVFVLLTFVVPRFANLFADMGHAMPLPTVILMQAGQFMRWYWWIGLLGLGALIIGVYRYGRTSDGRFRIDLMRLKTPILGGVLIKIAMARFCRTLGTLLNSGVHLMTALQASTGVAGNVVISRAVSGSMGKIREGKRVGATFAETGIFPDYVTEMVILGEESGMLGEMLVRVAETYEREVDHLVKGMTSVLEPLMILLMGGLVAFIVMAMLLPIFQMNLMIG